MTDRIWKFVHFLFELSFCFEFCVTVCYCAILFPVYLDVSYLNICAHLGIFLVLLFDALNNQILFFKRHFPIILGVFFIYFILNASYYFATGEEIYYKLNFVNWQSYVMIIVALSMIALSFFIATLVNRFKLYMLEGIRESERETLLQPLIYH